MRDNTPTFHSPPKSNLELSSTRYVVLLFAHKYRNIAGSCSPRIYKGRFIAPSATLVPSSFLSYTVIFPQSLRTLTTHSLAFNPLKPNDPRNLRYVDIGSLSQRWLSTSTISRLR